MDLAKFLIQAKTNTYASGESAPKSVLTDGCKELIYCEDNFKYRDRYFGHNPFMGEEIVWRGDEMIWGMNYYGTVRSDKISSRKVYNFLKKAMRQVGAERPFRGPSNFKEGDFEYVDKSHGDINMFRGVETILFKGQEVYKLYYHGGCM